MDLSQISDIDKLKALAYDELQRLEISKQNLQLINQRMSELQQSQAEKKGSKK